MARAAQKGELENPSPEVSKIASTVSKSDVKKMASTKHKGLPEKKPAEVNETVSLVSVLHKLKEEGYPARREGPQKGLGAALCPVCGQMGCTKDHDAEEEVKEGVVDTVKKGLKRHKKAVDAKKVKERKAPPYAALAAEYYPELPTTEGYQRDPEQSKKDRTHSKQPDPSKDGFTGIGNMSIKDIMKMNAKIKASEAAKTKKEEVELEEERKARKMNVRTKKTIQTTIAKNAAAEAKRKEKKTGEYKETPKKKPKLGLGYTTVVKHAQAKKAAAKKTPITRATAKKAEKKTAPSTKSVARTKAQYKGEGAPGLDAHKERIAKHEAKRGVKKPKAAKKTPVTKATTTKPAPKKAAARKSVTSTPITKAASTPKKKKTFGEFVKQGVKRHRKATQGARVFGKGFAKGVKKSVKFAKDVKKVVTNEQVNRISKMVKAIRRKKEVLKQPTMDHTTKKLHKWRKDKEQEEREKYVSPFKPIDYND